MRRYHLAILALAVVLSIQSLLPFAAHAEGESDPLWNQPTFAKKVNHVGQRLLAANGITERIAFIYSRQQVINATATRSGGNTIVVYKDLLGLMDSDDELAAVLSHEIAHITLRHQQRITPTRIGFSILNAAILVAAGAAGVDPSQMANRNSVGAMDIFTQRKLEKEADLAALDYLVKAGYNPLAMETIMNKIVSDGSASTQFFATHPMGIDRLQYIHTAIVNRFPQYLTEESRNNAVPGSPYQVASETTIPNRTVYANPNGNIATITTPGTASGQKSIAVAPAASNQSVQSTSKAQQDELYNQLNHILHPDKPVATTAPTATSATTQPKNGQTELMLATTPSLNTPLPGVSKPDLAQKQASTPSTGQPGTRKTDTQTKASAPTKADVAGTSTASTGKSTAPVYKSPDKVNYQPPGGVHQSPPKAVSTRRPQNNPGNPVSPIGKASTPPPIAVDAPTTGTDQPIPKPPSVSVAKALLELQPDALRLVKLVSQRGVMSHQDLAIEFESLDEETLDAMLLDLQTTRKLLRTSGSEPNVSYSLTPRAARVLRPH